MCHYVLVRKDLTPGQAIAQAVHAAGESAHLGGPTCQPVPGTVAVVLTTKDEAHLLQVAALLGQAGVPHHLVEECDGSAQALGIAPTRDRARLRKLLSNLPLYRA